MEEMEQIRALQADDEKGYMWLITEYTPYVSTIVYNMTSTLLTSSDMEEIVADVFFKIWRGRATLTGKNLKGTFITTTRNACVDAFRKHKQNFLPLEEDILQTTPTDALHGSVERREQMAIVEETVKGFGEPDQEIFLRFYYLGEPSRTISGQLGLSENTVKTKLRRAKEKLRRALMRGGYESA